MHASSRLMIGNIVLTKVPRPPMSSTQPTPPEMCVSSHVEFGEGLYIFSPSSLSQEIFFAPQEAHSSSEGNESRATAPTIVVQMEAQLLQSNPRRDPSTYGAGRVRRIFLWRRGGVPFSARGP